VAPLLNFGLGVKALRNIWMLTREATSEWAADRAPRLGAALSYYTVFSLAPVLILAIAVAGLFLGREAAQGEIVNYLTGTFGRDTAEVIQSALVKASEQKAGIIASIIGVITLLIGATGVMVELQGALDTVWKVMPRPGRGVRGFIKDRLLSLALVLTLGFLLLVSLVMSAALEAVSKWLGGMLPAWLILGYVLNYGVSLGVVALFLALIFKVLPDAKVAWKDVWIGATVTSVLFHLGKYLIALYIGRASVASAFGAAGSLAVLLVWIYYSSQIVLLGAEFTRAYANHFGSKVVPDEHAIPAPHAPEQRLAAQQDLDEAHASKAPAPGAHTRPSPA
jgi:membrane protein